MKTVLFILAIYLIIGLSFSILSKVIQNFIIKNKKLEKEVTSALREEFVRNDKVSYSEADEIVDFSKEDIHSNFSYIRLSIILFWLPGMIAVIIKLIVKNKKQG